jgi:hypothetical protein
VGWNNSVLTKHVRGSEIKVTLTALVPCTGVTQCLHVIPPQIAACATQVRRCTQPAYLR